MAYLLQYVIAQITMKKQYTSYTDTINFLQQAERDHPEVLTLETIGNTWENRPIVLAILSYKAHSAHMKPALLYTGSVHAREWIGNELAIKLIEYIITHYTSNPKLLSCLKGSSLYIVPCLNPDGFEYSRQHFSFWRKNRRDNGDGTYGVDLNRNFSSKFKRSTDTQLATYGGIHAFSEPETQAIKKFVDSHKNITISLDYHSQGNVFFPAHKFNHESEIEGTDLNVLCANMNREINKVTGRDYGIHRGKPPFNLIHGSAREYYYAKGILAVVVEVGTRNIPDYMQNMSKNIDENIPAVLYAFSEVRNYAPNAPKRAENFTIQKIHTDSVTLTWRYIESHHNKKENIYFELYRSEKNKSACSEQNLIAITQETKFKDKQLNSGHKYFYSIRAVNNITEIKSPFSPEINLKTHLSDNEFSRSLFPAKEEVGYIGQYTLAYNREHFANNSMFIGTSKKQGVCYGVVAFSLESLPLDIDIKSAVFSLYPMNRVAAKIENFGEWSISILSSNSIKDISNFDEIHQAVPLHTLGQTIGSDQLTQGIWREWCFNLVERNILKELISSRKLLLRLQGPTHLPLGNDSQIMQFDIGYGRFGGGIHYRPNLELIYSKRSQELALTPADINTICENEIKTGLLQSGFDKEGNIVYGQMAFTLEKLPHPDQTVITEAYLLMKNKNSLLTQRDIRFTIELAELNDLDYLSIKQRQKIEFIGYEVSNGQLKEKKTHHFIFDSYCRKQLERLHSENKPFYFIIRPTAISLEYNAFIDWHDEQDLNIAQLIIKYTKRLKIPPAQATQFSASVENTQLKLTWKRPDDNNLVGCYIVRNRFHPPRSPFDGVKLYAGKDEYTYDNYGNANISKYYSIFSYDDVPNYSCAVTLAYQANEKVELVENEDDYDSLKTDFGLDG